MASKWIVRFAVALILITALILILPFGQGSPAGPLERGASFTAALTAAGITLFVRFRIRRRGRERDDEPFDERSRLILEKTARITYAVFYLSALALANTLFILARLGADRLRYPAVTLYLCVAFIAVVHRLTLAYLRRRYA